MKYLGVFTGLICAFAPMVAHALYYPSDDFDVNGENCGAINYYFLQRAPYKEVNEPVNISNGINDAIVDSYKFRLVYGETFYSKGAFSVISASSLLNNHSDPDSLVGVRNKVNNYMDMFQDNMDNWMSRGSKYIPAMKRILINNELPQDLLYVSLVESRFNMKAVSPSAAAGPWQLVSETARRFDLKVNQWVDERFDPIKSTEAVSSYFKHLYDKFGSWDLAIAAYNAGEGTVERAMRAHNASNFWDLLNSSMVKKETKEFMSKFMAARELGVNSDYNDYGNTYNHSPPQSLEEIMNFDEVSVSPPATLSSIAGAVGASVATIRELNPALKKDCIPPGNEQYTVRIPAGTKDEFHTNYVRSSDTSIYKESINHDPTNPPLPKNSKPKKNNKEQKIKEHKSKESTKTENKKQSHQKSIADEKQNTKKHSSNPSNLSSSLKPTQKHTENATLQSKQAPQKSPKTSTPKTSKHTEPAIDKKSQTKHNKKT